MTAAAPAMVDEEEGEEREDCDDLRAGQVKRPSLRFSHQPDGGSTPQPLHRGPAGCRVER